MSFTNDLGRVIRVGIKMPKAEFDSKPRETKLAYAKDFGIAGLGTLIKAAYLTRFRLEGYQYALSAAGMYVGSQILGRFFRENHDKSRTEAQTAAEQFFKQHVNMVRPIEGFTGRAPRGTAEDRTAMACFGSSGKLFALLVAVRLNKAIVAVLMPAYECEQSAEAYFDFLKNDRETLRANFCQWNPLTRQWDADRNWTEIVWPKRGEGFDEE